MDKRIDGYDFIRSFAILVVFLGHAFKHSTNEIIFLGTRALSPGLTMSLLGFISAALLSARDEDFGAFLIKRFTRIYSSLIFCLMVILTIHALLGKKVMELSHAGHVMAQHTLFHFMGMSAWFGLLEVDSEVTIGPGLWFITVIVVLYLVLPILRKLFRHPRGLVHVVLFVALCTLLNFVTYGGQAMWNVVISFAVGVYCSANGYTKRLTETGARLMVPLVGCVGLLAVTALCTAHILPNSVRNLLCAFYPLAFVPVLFAVSQKLPKPILVVSGVFAGLSYEFYILHFYFLNDRFNDFFPASTPLYGQAIIAFIITFILAYAISKSAARFKQVADKYLLGSS
ncbi:MAG: acyltransferase family protein [Nitrospirota bacterium]